MNQRGGRAAAVAPVPQPVAAVPPSNLDAEAAVLSAVLLNPSVLPGLCKVLEPQHFFADANRHIFNAARELAGAGGSVDVVTVAGFLREKGHLQQIGGSPYLVQLADATPAIANVEAHAELIIEPWRRRQIMAAARHMAAEVQGDVGDLGEWLAGHQKRLEEIALGRGNAGFETTESVLTGWSEGGPLLHERTGIARLDELTGGGPVYGTRWYIAGAPDAGKTALLIQLADTFARRGISVGLLAVDEEPSDLVMRLAQRIGYDRHHCEARDPAVIGQMREKLGALPLRLYDSAWTIESSAADLAAFAAGRGSGAVLCIDSVQTAHCAADRAALAGGRELSEASAVTARAYAIRAVASRHKLIAIATSELGRSAYRSGDPTQQTSTLASAKWSGAIEYSARVLIGLRSVAEQPELVELELAKNKHGPRDERFHLRIDRRGQTLSQVQYDPPPPASSATRDAAAKDRVATDAVVVAKVLLAKPGLGARDLRAAVKAAGGFGSDRTDAAIQYLGAAVVKGQAARGATPMTLAVALLPDAIRAQL